MERILVPLDESPLAQAVLPVVLRLADQGTEVILLRAVEFPNPLWKDAIHAEAPSITEAETALRTLATSLEEKRGEQVRSVVWSGDAAQVIHDAAKAYGADLIAMATHGRGGLSRLLLGSVAAAVVRSTPVPVLLLRGGLSEPTWSLKKLLVPLSGGSQSETILPVVAGLAGPTDLAVHLVEVLEPLPTSVESVPGDEELWAFRRTQAGQYLEKVTERLSAKGLRVSWSVRAGRAPETIISTARETGADLIAMATHGRGLLGRLVFGSVADAVLEAAPVPVLLLRMSESS